MAYERDPERHASQVKMYQSAFRTQALRDQEDVIHLHIDTLVKQLLRLSNANGSVDMARAAEWLTFDIIGDLTFGESFGAVEKAQSHAWVDMLLNALYGTTVMAMTKRAPILQYLLPWLIPKSALESLALHQQFTFEKVRRRIEIGDSNRREDLFAHVIRNKLQTEEQMVQEATLFLMAGAETAATTLTTAFYFIIRHPDVQQKLHTELDKAFSSYESITGDAVAKLPYLNAVLEETMRTFPPVPPGPPRVSPGEYVDGIYVPKGTYVSTDIMSLHRHPLNAPSPHTFDPERWLKNDREKPYTAPFSIGPRMCIGVNLAWLEMRVTLAKIAYAYDWKFATDPGDWPNTCRLTQLWKKPALKCLFSPRSTEHSHKA
ncbi:hypothetical protein PFICI_03606 [Pestalotiopsis fici W106-1]|uniref:Uncharacterized protein n=1 Tax=Pestalotiopsis fici (strain W106-1 / CGMCC3.15140) TaxID=1229662 RepID=W3XK10_PESFW|nr:uncharacterized protein PFICI_03606 [Pestalotiopsis fici W106-1]ETS85581.1 hypothetical protein PFICI_03606 [Pestalotiopsis fici W106-1]